MLQIYVTFKSYIKKAEGQCDIFFMISNFFQALNPPEICLLFCRLFLQVLLSAHALPAGSLPEKARVLCPCCFFPYHAPVSAARGLLPHFPFLYLLKKTAPASKIKKTARKTFFKNISERFARITKKPVIRKYIRCLLKKVLTLI